MGRKSKKATLSLALESLTEVEDLQEEDHPLRTKHLCLVQSFSNTVSRDSNINDQMVG